MTYVSVLNGIIRKIVSKSKPKKVYREQYISDDDSEQEFDPQDLLDISRPPPSNFVWPPNNSENGEAPIYVPPPETQRIIAKPCTSIPSCYSKPQKHFLSAPELNTASLSQNVDLECCEESCTSTCTITTASTTSSESEYKMYQTQNNQFRTPYIQPKSDSENITNFVESANERKQSIGSAEITSYMTQEVYENAVEDIRASPSPLKILPKTTKHVEFIEPGEDYCAQTFSNVFSSRKETWQKLTQSTTSSVEKRDSVTENGAAPEFDEIEPELRQSSAQYQLPPSRIPQPTPKSYQSEMHKALITTSERPYNICNVPPTPEPTTPVNFDLYVDAIIEAGKYENFHQETSKIDSEPKRTPKKPERLETTPNKPNEFPHTNAHPRKGTLLSSLLTTVSPTPIEFVQPNTIELVPLPKEAKPYFPPPISMVPNEPMISIDSYRVQSPFVGALQTVPDRPFTPFAQEVLSQLSLDLPHGVPKTFLNALDTAPDVSYKTSLLNYSNEVDPVEYKAKVYERIDLVETEDADEAYESSAFVQVRGSSNSLRSFLPQIQPWSKPNENCFISSYTDAMCCQDTNCQVSESRRCSDIESYHCELEEPCEKKPIYPKRNQPPSPFEGMQVKVTNKLTSGLHKPDNIPKYQQKWFNLPTQNPPKTPELEELKDNVPIAYIQEANESVIACKISDAENENFSSRKNSSSEKYFPQSEAQDEFLDYHFPMKVGQIIDGFPSRKRENSLAGNELRQVLQFEKQKNLRDELQQRQRQFKDQSISRQNRQLQHVLENATSHNEYQLTKSREIIPVNLENTNVSEQMAKDTITYDEKMRKKQEYEARMAEYKRLEEEKIKKRNDQEKKLKEKRERDLQEQMRREEEYIKVRQIQEEEMSKKQELDEELLRKQQEAMELEMRRVCEKKIKDQKLKEDRDAQAKRLKEQRDQELRQLEEELRIKREEELRRLEQEIREKREQKERDQKQNDVRNTQERLLRDQQEKEARRLQFLMHQENVHQMSVKQPNKQVDEDVFKEQVRRERQERILFDMTDDNSDQQQMYASVVQQQQKVWPPATPTIQALPRTIPIIRTDSEQELSSGNRFQFEPLDDHARSFMAGIRPPSTSYSPATEDKPFPSIPYYQQHLAFYEATADKTGVFNPKVLSPTPNRSKSPAFGPPPNPMFACTPKIKSIDTDESGVYLCGGKLLSPIWYHDKQIPIPLDIQKKIQSSSRPSSKPDFDILHRMAKKHMEKSNSNQLQVNGYDDMHAQKQARKEIEFERAKSEKTIEVVRSIGGPKKPDTPVEEIIEPNGDLPPKGIVANQIRRLSGDALITQFPSKALHSSSENTRTRNTPERFPVKSIEDVQKMSQYFASETSSKMNSDRQMTFAPTLPASHFIASESSASAQIPKTQTNPNLTKNDPSQNQIGGVAKHGRTFTTTGPNRGCGVLQQASSGRVPICSACTSQIR